MARKIGHAAPLLDGGWDTLNSIAGFVSSRPDSQAAETLRELRARHKENCPPVEVALKEAAAVLARFGELETFQIWRYSNERCWTSWNLSHQISREKLRAV